MVQDWASLESYLSGVRRLEFCISIDVERDFRKDAGLTVRGLVEGLPSFLDMLISRSIPFDLMVSSEILDAIPKDIVHARSDLVALGCHGRTHEPGYPARLSPARQRHELNRATETVERQWGRRPLIFRAPNFCANANTLDALIRLGYEKDSSVLPGRWVRRWGFLTTIDHRGAPERPYRPDPSRISRPGRSSILEVPVSPNPHVPGTPLGLGYLHAKGLEATLSAARPQERHNWVFLAHPWEMVRWEPGDAVAPWVRAVASPDPRHLESLISALSNSRFVNMHSISEEAPPLASHR